MKIFVINGPNINMLGIRETEIYGTSSYNDLINLINTWGKDNNVEVISLQSNIEGEIVNYIQQAYFESADGIVINPAGYTHTSVAILDALKATKLPTIEVHISNIDSREDFRKKSYIKEYCISSIIGEGIIGYITALNLLKKHVEENYVRK